MRDGELGEGQRDGQEGERRDEEGREEGGRLKCDRGGKIEEGQGLRIVGSPVNFVSSPA